MCYFVQFYHLHLVVYCSPNRVQVWVDYKHLARTSMVKVLTMNNSTVPTKADQMLCSDNILKQADLCLRMREAQITGPLPTLLW